jgi:hypothetical protein
VATVEEEEFEDDLVIMNTSTETVVTLNGAARLVWTALVDDVTLEQLAALFFEAIPDADPAAVRRDIAATLESLSEAELVTVSQNRT